MLRLVVVVLAFFAAGAFADTWELAYFYDVDNETLHITDLKFISATRGVAVGAILPVNKSPRPVALVTSDGGKNWSIVETREAGLSLFFLDETAGWKVTDSGVWFTEEAGRSWTKILKRQGLHRVHFISRERGWAIGSRKTVLETADGGKTWKAMPVVQNLKTSPDSTSFYAIDFASPDVGIIAGASRPLTREEQRMPPWASATPQAQRERPTLSISLSTANGGKTWDTSTTSMFGQMRQLDLLPDLTGLALIEFQRLFAYPSEVFRISLDGHGATRVLRKADFAITSIARSASTAYAAGFVPAGRLAAAPIPGRVRIESSTDLQTWTAAAIDYRAIANYVAISVASDGQAWASTDTGMILKLRKN